MRRNLGTGCRVLAAALAGVLGAAPAVAGNFKLNTGTYTVPIAYDGAKVDVRTILGTIPTYTDVYSGPTKWARTAKIDEGTLKTAALAMALGNSIFLQLSDLEADLKATTLADKNLDKTAIAAKVVDSMGVNQWFSTALQESRFVYAEHSGYYQIDNAPADILTNASGAPTARKASKYKFLRNLKGGASANLYVDSSGKGAVLNFMNLQGFVWASVEKGYFEAVGYNINKTAYNDQPAKGFSFPQWAMNYAATAANATHYPLTTTQLSGMNLDPSLGFPQAMGLLYNRGQYPFVYPAIYPGSVLNPVLAGNGTVTFQSKIAFQVPKSKDDPPDVWGSAYVWQLPWLISAQNATGELYQEKVSAAEVVTMLNLLKGMYNGADATKADAVVDAAIALVGKLSWDQPYKSDTTYDNIQKVAKAILDASN